MTGNSMRPRVMWLPVRIAAVHQTGEYHFHKDIRRYVTPAPFGVEVFSRRCSHYFIHCFSCPNQNLDALPNLHEHVTVILEI